MWTFNNGKLYFVVYVLLAFGFGFYWFTIKAKLNSFEIEEPVLRFLTRFFFWIGIFIFGDNLL